MLEQILVEEVPFGNRPDFEIFYGGLDTHIEHHLFPDLPRTASARWHRSSAKSPRGMDSPIT